MPLEVRPLEDADFDALSLDIYSKGGDLISPSVPLCWPHGDDASNTKRCKWSMEQQRTIFHKDPSVRFMKVVDTDRDDESVSLARWHFYEKGYKHPEFSALELAEENWPKEASLPLAKAILEPLFESRSSWMGEKPQWVLCTIMTKEPQRGRGAGALLVKWGVEQARKDKTPAYLEAVAQAVPLYERCGFTKVGEQAIDIGAPEPIIAARMAANIS